MVIAFYLSYLFVQKAFETMYGEEKYIIAFSFSIILSICSSLHNIIKRTKQKSTEIGLTNNDVFVLRPFDDWLKRKKEEIFDATEMQISSSTKMKNKQLKLFGFY